MVIVGITPGLFQMKQAFSTVHRVKDYLSDNEKILHEVKKNSSFQGPMRKNLIAMRDSWWKKMKVKDIIGKVEKVQKGILTLYFSKRITHIGFENIIIIFTTSNHNVIMKSG